MKPQLLAGATLLALAAVPAAAQEPPAHQASRTMSTTATVEKVDARNHELMLRAPDGHLFTIYVPENVRRLDQVKAGDRLDIGYHEALAVSLHKPGTPPVAERHETQRLPGRPAGIEAREVSATVEVVSVDPQRNELTIRRPSGELATIQVQDPQAQAKLVNLSPGDRLDVTYTQAIAVAVTPHAR